MPMHKVCAAGGCTDLAEPGAALCDWHGRKAAARRAASKAAVHARSEVHAARALYKLAAWQRGRASFLRANPVCVDCATVGLVEPAVEVDHVTPHKGDRRLFFDRSNWQALCKACHSRKTAREVWHGQGQGGVVEK